MRTLSIILSAVAVVAVADERWCEPKGSLQTDPDSQRVAFVLRGDAFRGLSYGVNVQGTKTGFYCTRASHQIQRAITASHVGHIITPLERAGWSVDVFLATYGCSGLVSDVNADAAMRHLTAWYSQNATVPRIRRSRAIERRGSTQATTVNVAMAWLRELWPPKGYRAVLIWRLDMPALSPIGTISLDAEGGDSRPTPPTVECDRRRETNSSAPTARPMACWCEPYCGWNGRSRGGWGGYATRLGDAYYKYEDDWGFSFPGHLARCAVPVFESDCLGMQRGIQSHECAFRLARTGPVLHAAPTAWTVYREDFSVGDERSGATTCRLLRDVFDGPPCPETPAAGRRAACLRIARVGKFTAPADVKRSGMKGRWEDFGCPDIVSFRS